MKVILWLYSIRFMLRLNYLVKKSTFDSVFQLEREDFTPGFVGYHYLNEGYVLVIFNTLYVKTGLFCQKYTCIRCFNLKERVLLQVS